MIEARGLSYQVPGRQILTDINLSVQRGRSLALTGPSGSGKSTLLTLLAGLIRPQAGSVLHDGRDLSTLDAAAVRRRTGIVFQSYGLLSLLSAAENIELAAQARGLPRAAVAGHVHAALQSVGLEARGDHLVEELSGGEQQRVAIARALVGDPDLVLADEPTAELDEHNREKAITLLLQVPASGRTLLLATHDADVATACDHDIHLRDGTIVASS